MPDRKKGGGEFQLEAGGAEFSIWRFAMTSAKELLIFGLSLGLAIGACSCGSKSEAQKTAEQETKAARESAKKAGDEIADAVKNAKPELNKAGEKVGEAARTVAEDAKAAARGAEDGWNKGKQPLVNLNTAREKDLVALPGIGPREARQIIAGRPYKDAHETVKRGALSEAEYEEIQDRVTTR
jgi:DNA uptake protein ComE-like DNA-binding protein